VWATYVFLCLFFETYVRLSTKFAAALLMVFVKCNETGNIETAIQVSNSDIQVSDEYLSDLLFDSLLSNVKKCESYEMPNKNFKFNPKYSQLFIHLDIASLQV